MQGYFKIYEQLVASNAALSPARLGYIRLSGVLIRALLELVVLTNYTRVSFATLPKDIINIIFDILASDIVCESQESFKYAGNRLVQRH